jgi:hypothetical protein
MVDGAKTRRAHVYVVSFRRRKSSDLERGIMIECDNTQLIVDAECLPVKSPIWKFEREEYQGCFNAMVSKQIKEAPDPLRHRES